MGNRAMDIVNDQLHSVVDMNFDVVPASHVVRRIHLLPSTDGSVNLGVTQVDMLSCYVIYEWGRRNAPYCFLVDSMDKAVFQRKEPSIYLLNDAQADQFVKDPYVAYKQKVNGWKLRSCSYRDYLEGKI